jgi:polar amino acid transport system permease protein
MNEIAALIKWTPFLLGGFGWNIAIGVLAMTIGTSIGIVLASLRLSDKKWLRNLSYALTTLSCNVPTIVFQFYLVIMLPSEWEIPGLEWTINFPAWLKAALALAIAVLGFTSNNLMIALRQWRAGNHSAAMLFIPAWINYMLIIIMASSTASIIGVSEILSRCNIIISASNYGNDGRLMLPVYLYVSLIFLFFCYPLNYLMKKLQSYLHTKFV